MEEIQCAAPPAVSDVINNFVNNENILYDKHTPKGNKIDDKWEYYSKNNDFLLRFGLVKIPGKEDLIRLEVLDTKNISEKYEMFAEFFKKEDLVEELEINKKNIDAFTYILMLFETNPPEGEINKEKNEFKLIIKKYEGKKYMLNLKNTICEDDNFFRKNMEKKMKQLENNLETICSNLENGNKELNNKNNLLENELNEIITANENLENNNKVLSKALQDLEKSQDKVLVHLDQLND